MKSSPHLGQMENKFRSRGFKVVAVSNESESKISDFVDSYSAGYGIAKASGVASLLKYKGGIPHAWVLDKDGKILWDGHPARVNDAMIDAWLGGAAAPAGATEIPPGESGDMSFLWKFLVFLLLSAIVGIALFKLVNKSTPPQSALYFPNQPPAGAPPPGMPPAGAPYPQAPPQGMAIPYAPSPPPSQAQASQPKPTGAQAALNCRYCGAPLRPGRKKCMGCGADA